MTIHRAVSCAVVCFLAVWPPLRIVLAADGPVETWSYLTPTTRGNCQVYHGPEALDTYTIGLTAGITKPGEPLEVMDVANGGPAASAGIQKGDSLSGSDSNGLPVVIDSCELLREELSGKDLVLYDRHKGQTDPTRIVIHPKLLRDAFPGQAQVGWKVVSEFVDGGRFLALGALARGSQGDFELRVAIRNFQTDSVLQLEEGKIFLVDDQGAEFSHQPFAEWKRYLESLVAQANALANGMEAIPYVPPPPPPPPTHYHISSSVDGNYLVTPMGAGVYQVSGQSQVASTVSPEYTPNEQIAQAARGIASIFDAIRTARANKEIKRLRERAASNAASLQKLLADGTASHLDTTSPVAPGARRSGAVAFVQPRNFSSSAVKAIVVINDILTHKDYFVTFEFHL
jgi:hypothetical protein